MFVVGCKKFVVVVFGQCNSLCVDCWLSLDIFNDARCLLPVVVCCVVCVGFNVVAPGVCCRLLLGVLRGIVRCLFVGVGCLLCVGWLVGRCLLLVVVS